MCPWQCVQRRPCGLLTRPTRPTTRLIPTRQRGFLASMSSVLFATVLNPLPLVVSGGRELTGPVLSSIAFQYYPLDMNTDTNPFIVSWWPLALEDPALFHVSLQTASLDEELRAQRGFAVSEALMVDSVCELRKKIEHSSSAVQDETINAVVTLAAIEVSQPSCNSYLSHLTPATIARKRKFRV